VYGPWRPASPMTASRSGTRSRLWNICTSSSPMPAWCRIRRRREPTAARSAARCIRAFRGSEIRAGGAGRARRRVL